MWQESIDARMILPCSSESRPCDDELSARLDARVDEPELAAYCLEIELRP